MNKTVNINLASIFFHIDEDAFLKLERYLEAIKRSFTDSQGRSEIISDIEARIAELFSERIQNEKQVVNIKLVDEVITIMGQPEDYLVDDEIFEDEPQQKKTYSTKSTKKLFRDADNSYIGGVAAGLGHYLGIDSIWVRLIWLLLVLGSGGTFIVIYLIFWALVPEAKTTAEKLTMTGDAVNISNIEKKIKDGIDTVSEKVKNVDFKKQSEKIKEGFDNVADNISETVKSVDFQKQGNRLKSSSQTFFDTIGSILMFFLKVLAKIIGIVLIIAGIVSLLTLLITMISVVIGAINFPGIERVNAFNLANTPEWLIATLVFFAFGVPFFFIFYIGLKILVNNLKSIGNVAKFTLLGLWIMAIIGLVIVGVRQVAEHSNDAKVVIKEELNIKPNDTLKIRMVDEQNYSDLYYRHNNHYKLTEDEDGFLISSTDLRLIVRSTSDSIGRIVIEKKADGRTYNSAKSRAENINYNYTLANNELQLNAYLTTDAKHKFSNQEATVIVYLPIESVFYADDNTHNYHQNRSYANDILKSGMEEHYLKVINDDVECLDCTEEASADINDIESVKSVIINNSETEEKPEVNIQINEEDGVSIEVSDN